MKVIVDRRSAKKGQSQQRSARPDSREEDGPLQGSPSKKLQKEEVKPANSNSTNLKPSKHITKHHETSRNII
jgi:hypothetical protein